MTAEEREVTWDKLVEFLNKQSWCESGTWRRRFDKEIVKGTATPDDFEGSVELGLKIHVEEREVLLTAFRIIKGMNSAVTHSTTYGFTPPITRPHPTLDIAKDALDNLKGAVDLERFVMYPLW